MSKHIYIHIGVTKTGTTALQKFLWANQKILREHDISVIPTFECKQFSGLFFDFPEWQNRMQIKRNKFKWKERFLKNIKTAPCQSVLISNERFSFFEIENINELQKQFTGDSVKVICYLRRQDTWLESQYQQCFKSRPAFSKPFKNWLDDLSPRMGSICNSYDLLSKWAGVFGKENIIVRPYEKQQFINQDLFEDFLSLFGLKLTPDYQSITDKNVSIDQNFLELIRLANAVPVESRSQQISAKSHHFVSDKLTALAPQSVKLSKRPKNVFLGPSQRMEILKEYEDNNQRVAREYLGRKDGKLFYGPLPDINEPYEPHQLTVEKVTPIFIEMIYNLNKHLKKLEQQLDYDSLRLQELQRSKREKYKNRVKRIIPSRLYPLARSVWNKIRQ